MGLVLGTLVMAACGGKAIVDPPLPTGAGGAGGAGGQTATGGASVVSVVTTTTSNNAVVTTTAQTSSVSTTVTTSSGPNSCDGTGQCDICFECSTQGPCVSDWIACSQSDACVGMSQCMEGCMGQTCFQTCAQQNPGGVQLFLAALQCSLCDACSSDCDPPPQLCNN